MALVVIGPCREKHDPKIGKETKFELSWTFLASLRPVSAFRLSNILPLEIALVVIRPQKAEHNPKLCKQSKFELSGTILASPRPIFAFRLVN